MTSEEIDLNERLAHHDLEPVETDLGEYIIQLAHERPYHIVAPALHKTRYEVADLFTAKLGVPREDVIEKQTKIARAVLREKFLAADIGIIGRQLPDRGFRSGDHRRERGQRSADHHGAQDPRRDRGDRENDSARAGPGGVPETARPQRHRAGADRLYVVPHRTAPRRRRSTGPTSSTSCCSTTAARGCWRTARSGNRSTASAAAPA